eukprot:c25532_g1_i1 orf=311-1030(-)
MATALQPKLPVYDATSDSPSLFDGTTRLYISYTCPFAQRTWIARNFKGLNAVELVAINLTSKPSWYLEKVYPVGQVPSLEHNGKVIGESLDLLEYIDKNFDGPSILPSDPAKQEAVKELFAYSNTFNQTGFTTLRKSELNKATIDETFGPVLDHLESELGKFADEGPFLVGQLGAVDFAYIPFVERFQILFSELANYDITEGRPKLAEWIKALNEQEAYTTTKADPKVLAEQLKRRLGK